MFFDKKRSKNDSKNQLQKDVVDQQTEQNPPQKRGLFARAKDGVTQSATKVKQKAQKTVSRARKIKMFFDIVTTLFFIGNSLYWVFKKWGDFGNLVWIMLAVTAVYILVFVITIIVHSKNQQQMALDNKKFKVKLKLWKALTNLLFIAMSALTLVQNLKAWQADGDVLMLVTMLISGFVLFVKLLSTIGKIFKLNIKRKKLNKKQQKYDAKQKQLRGEQQ